MKIKRGKAVAGLVAGLTSEDATAFSEILNRIKQAANVSSDNAIARVLGLRQSSISTAKTRGSIPPSWIINASNLFNISADWLIYGDEKFPDKAPAESQQPPAESPPPTKKISNNDKKIIEDKALDLSVAEFKDLWDEYWSEREARRGWLQVEVIKRFPEFIEWLEQRQDPLKPAQIAALKKREQLLHYGLPNQLEDD